MALHISCLPDNVLTYIFEFLDNEERLNACLVCKDWLQTVNCHQLLWDIRLEFVEEIDGPALIHMTRRFEQFVFRNIAIDNFVIEFLSKYCRQMVKLTLIDCNLHEECQFRFLNNILKCDNLNALYIRRSNVVPLFASLPKVTTLVLDLYDGMTDYVLCDLSRCLLKVERLVLFDLTADERIMTRPKKRRFNPEEICPLNFKFSFESVKKFIQKQSKTLKRLDLSNTGFSSDNVITISKIKDLKLDSIAFPPTTHALVVKEFCENQSSLTYVDFSVHYFMANDAVRIVCKCLPNLKKLKFCAPSDLNNSIIEIFRLKHLSVLNLFGRTFISERIYREAFLNLKTNKLVYLNLAKSQISDDSLFKLLKFNPDIRTLILDKTKLSNKTLNMICKNLIQIEKLSIAKCKAISDSGLTGEIECYSDSSTPTPLSNLKHLRFLNLSGNSLITNRGCMKAMKFLELEYLLLRGCDGLKLTKNFVSKLKGQNPRAKFFFNVIEENFDDSLYGHLQYAL
ncbi:hypothetical protein NPIL_493211 [Nephila pilipes]|uniref:F-box domain-containing protein n=1 Tax=Nephila pilipes TaxID=299642 RepID=A0A8X6QTQ3_NEPPI|nr:hypothetical protein NPIL_493211 [Nephila pilipes]